MSGRRLGKRLRGGAAAFRGSWHNPALRRAQLCFAGAWTAEWAFTVGLGVLAYERGGAAAVGAVSLMRMLPAAFVTPFAAVYGDRWRRERILLVVTGGRGVALGLMAVLAWLEVAVGVIYGLAVVATIAGVLFRPVHSALVPTLCRTPAELTGANVVRGMLDSLSTLVGPLMAAVLLAVSGPGAVFAACAVASLWAAWLITGVAPEVMATEVMAAEPDGATESAAAPASVVADLVEGLRMIGRERHLTVLVVLAEVQTLMRGALTVFSVVVAIDLLDMGESGVGTLNAAVGTGAVLGSLAVSLLVGNHRLARWFGVGVALWGLPMALIGIVPVQGVALFLLLFIGVGNALVDVGIFTLVARLTPPTMVARVFGAMEGIGALCVGVGAVLTPVAIELLGLRGALVAIGLVSPTLVAVSWLRLRRLDGSIERRDQEVDLLHAVPMLAGLPLPAVGELAIALEPVTVPQGQVVFAQGDLGDRCYFVESGSAVVIGDGREVTELGAGEMFGEIALLRQVPRTATVRAGSELHLQALRSEAFLPVVTGYRSSAGRATADIDARLHRFAPRGPWPDDDQDV